MKCRELDVALWIMKFLVERILGQGMMNSYSTCLTNEVGEFDEVSNQILSFILRLMWLQHHILSGNNYRMAMHSIVESD